MSKVGSGGVRVHLAVIGPFFFLLFNKPNICLEPKLINLQDQLSYTCVCENGISPNITQYSQTLPFYICQEWGTQCVNNCNGDNTCAQSCRSDHPCGAQSPYRGNASISSTMSSTSGPTGSATRPAVTGFGGAAATSAAGGSTGAAAGAFIPGAATSMAVLFGSVFLGFAVLL